MKHAFELNREELAAKHHHQAAVLALGRRMEELGRGHQVELVKLTVDELRARRGRVVDSRHHEYDSTRTG